MAKVYLASSALIKEGYDGLRTIVEAHKAGFDGVQLFLDPKYRQDRYLARITNALAFSNLGLVVHLPNEVCPADIQATEKLVKSRPDAKVLIHYLPITQLPNLNGARVGWENSQTGWDPIDIRKTKDAANRDGTFFAYDLGRQLVLDGKVTPDTAVRAVKRNIQHLKPHKDIIHAADKDNWNSRFRDHWLPLGQGICAGLLADIRNYQGIVVLEHEDLQMAVASLSALR